MDIRRHFLNLVNSKGGFKPLHAHFDKSNVVDSELLKRAQQAHMQEKWYIYREIKNNYTYANVYSRSEKALHSLINQNIKVARTFVDADQQVGQMCIDAVLQLKEDYKSLIDLEIAVQPIEGIAKQDARQAFEEACSKADLVGGLPSRDPDGADHLRALFEIATKYDLPVDVHVDQLNSKKEKETELLLNIKDEVSFENKVNAVHSISLSCHDIEYQKEIAGRLVDQEVGVIICPSAALSMKQPQELTTTHNSIAPLELLNSYGVELALGIDNISDLFMPLVDGDMWFECRLLMEATRCYDLELISTIATRYV